MKINLKIWRQNSSQENGDFEKYEVIYQLYYSLLNVYLWDRSYIEDVSKLLEKIKI